MARRKRKLTKAEREEMDARHVRVRQNVLRTRELAERGLAKLEGRPPRPVVLPDHETIQVIAVRVLKNLLIHGSPP